MRLALQLMWFAVVFSFTTLGSASSATTREGVVTPHNFSASISNALESLMQDEIFHLGSRRGQRVSIPDLLHIVRSNQIRFVTVPYIAKPDSANRFSAFSDPVNRTVFINAYDPMINKLLRPIALHEFFMNVGIDDAEYQLALLIDAYLNVSHDLSFAFIIDPAAAREKRKLLKTLLLNAMNQYVRHTGGARPFVTMVEANNKIHLPDGGSSVGNGGDSNDIFFKREILNHFMTHFMRNSSAINTDTTAFLIDLVSLRVRLNFVELSETRYFISKTTNMLSLVYTSISPSSFERALRFAKNYTILQWNSKNGNYLHANAEETIFKKMRGQPANLRCLKLEPNLDTLTSLRKSKSQSLDSEAKLVLPFRLSHVESEAQLKELCGDY